MITNISEYLIAFVAILVFLAVIFVIWRGGKLSVKVKDIGVDAEGNKQPGPADQLSQAEGTFSPSMSMTASGKDSGITGSKQSITGTPAGSPNMEMTAEEGGKIKDSEQSISNQNP
jgi:hypothetical protein